MLQSETKTYTNHYPTIFDDLSSKKELSINYDNLQFTTSLEYIRAYIDLKTTPQTMVITIKAKRRLGKQRG